jgi:hypothetical protein
MPEATPRTTRTTAPDAAVAPEPEVPLFPATKGATVHHSSMSGRVTLIADAEIRASELGAALALHVPADALLLESISNAETIMLIFRGQQPGTAGRG